MVDYIKYTPEMANNWSRAYIETHKERPWAFQRLVDASTTSQLESKFWLTEELSNIDERPKSAVLLGGWFAHVITSLLLDYTSVEKVTNFEIDEDAHFISYKFNRRYKKKEEIGYHGVPDGDAQYRSIRRNVLFESLLTKRLVIMSTKANSGKFVNNKNCLLYNNETELDDFLIRILNDTNFDHIVESGYNAVKQKYSMDLMVSSYNNLIKSILNK